MSDNAILDQAAKRLLTAFAAPKQDLTIKVISGTVQSIGANHSTAIVDIGGSKIKALNKSNDKLSTGESVWVGYIGSLADAVILFRTGISTPGGGGGGGGGAVIGDVVIRSNGTYRAQASGYDGFGTVEVDVPTVTPMIGEFDNAIIDESVRLYVKVENNIY
ncbi:MAG: hypothetical protein IJ555_10425 [Ruminococcus sp.]|nr:hypothetical protein [Ruminococcus sp.]